MNSSLYINGFRAFWTDCNSKMPLYPLFLGKALQREDK